MAARTRLVTPFSIQTLIVAPCVFALLCSLASAGAQAAIGPAEARAIFAHSKDKLLQLRTVHAPSFSMPLDELKARVELAQGFALQATEIDPQRSPAPAPRCCPRCGGRLRYQRTILPPRARLPIAQASPPMVPSPAPG